MWIFSWDENDEDDDEDDDDHLDKDRVRILFNDFS